MHSQKDNVHVARFGPEHSAGARESIAVVLRRAREKHGQDVRSVAQVLRIRQAYLEALESGDFDRLPGTAYALGFLRTYADYLGLSANDIVDRFKEEAQAPERPTELVFPEPVAEGRIPGGAIILISVVLLVVAYGGWFYLSNQGRSVADLIPGMPEQIQTYIDGEPAQPAAQPETPVIKAEAPARPQPAPEPSPAKIEPRQAAEDRPAELQQAAPQAPAAAPEAAQPEPEVPQDVADTPDGVAETPEAVAETPERAPARIAVAAPEPVGQPEALEPPAQSAPAVQSSPAGQNSQVAVLPSDDAAPESATDYYSSAPARPDPAPEPSMQRDGPASARPQAQERTQEQARATPVLEPTVVIPAPPLAPRSFARPGERTPQVYGESNEDARIVLRALQDSWVQVRDSQDALLLTRVLRNGDTYRVPDRAGLTLLTGNAGGIELEVDGIRLAPLGPVGAVRRQIALDPSALLTGGAQH